MSDLGPDDVLRFWFPKEPGDDDAMRQRLEWWFRGGADEQILARFRPLLDRAIAGALDEWSHSPRSRLALILVFDQFSRTIYRGTARAFAQDPRAVSLTLEGLSNGHYAGLTDPWQKTFFFLPLGHSEQIEHLERSVALAEELALNAPADQRKMLEFSAGQARGHRDVVARFGRQPHRNAVLGRESTPAELEYLARGELVHQRSPPK